MELTEKYETLQAKIPKLLDSIAEQSLIKIVGFEDLDDDSKWAVLDELYFIVKHLENCDSALKLKLP